MGLRPIQTGPLQGALAPKKVLATLALASKAGCAFTHIKASLDVSVSASQRPYEGLRPDSSQVKHA